MNSLPIEYFHLAIDDLKSIPSEFRPATLELLSRLSANYRTCSKPGPANRPPSLNCGLWCRRSDGSGALIEILFRIFATEDKIVVRRVLFTPVARMPGYVTRREEWGEDSPWPVVDL